MPDALFSSVGALIFKSQQLGSALVRGKGVGRDRGEFFLKDVMGRGCAFVWPLYNLAHVYNRETLRLCVFDPHEQCEACRLGVRLVFQVFYSGIRRRH